MPGKALAGGSRIDPRTLALVALLLAAGGSLLTALNIFYEYLLLDSVRRLETQFGPIQVPPTRMLNFYTAVGHGVADLVVMALVALVAWRLLRDGRGARQAATAAFILWTANKLAGMLDFTPLLGGFGPVLASGTVGLRIGVAVVVQVAVGAALLYLVFTATPAAGQAPRSTSGG